MNEQDQEELKLAEGLINARIMELFADMTARIDQTPEQLIIRKEHYRDLIGARRVVRALLRGDRPLEVLNEIESEHVPLLEKAATEARLMQQAREQFERRHRGRLGLPQADWGISG